MTKKQVIASLAVSTLVLSTAGTAFADEVIPLDPTTPSTEMVTPEPSSQPEQPTEPSVSTDTSATDTGSTTEPTVPVDPTTPSTGDNTGDNSSTNPGTSEDESSDPGSETTEPENPAEPEQPSTEPTEQPGEVEVPTTDGGTATVTPDTSVPTNNPNITAETAQNAGASQVGTTSTVTGQVVRDVTRSNPVTLYNGASLVDIRDGFVTLSSGEKVTPESVGVTANADGTYTAKTIQGDMVTLPHTGEKNTTILSVLGAFILSVLGFSLKKRNNQES